ANQLNKGTTFALKRFRVFIRKVSHPVYESGFCLKADVKHYFPQINHEILLEIISKNISDKNMLCLVKQILANSNFNMGGERKKGMPLGNYTSQFLANVYLNELDYFVKFEFKAKYYIRYVDDFVILHSSKEQLEEWKEKINLFLKEKLKLELHRDKSRIIPISRGVDFVGFRNFYHYRLLRKRNIRKMWKKINLYKNGTLSFSKLYDSYKGWQAYAKWADAFNLKEKVKVQIINLLWNKI
ncbi:MAG: RNA-directed DNA polymerase, partial [Nanoarchaeota archaeon]